jgi:FkbM family methyltransferase
MSIVYSVGIGEDTSWDEAMIADHGLHVFGFDPTPKAAAFVRANTALGDHFHFTEEGLATEEGTMTFTKPENPDHVSLRAGALDGLGEQISLPVNTLENWMDSLGHSKLDILKLDIEGSEYGVLESWIDRQYFPMDQLLVEFHHRFLESKEQHNRVLEGLKRSGFEITNDNYGQEISSLRTTTPS